mmetsp:Transcript_21632/g.64766  ORF Transcript_21632/g.64766 Transcript_21632/m.64766 type:complete len:102 (+) Transcript_21632:1875-2180(+)
MRREYSFLTGLSLPTSIVHCDNESTIKHFVRRTWTARSRHIKVYLGFIYDAIDAGLVRTRHRESKLNETNTLTKSEDPETFRRSMIAMAGLPSGYMLAPRA